MRLICLSLGLGACHNLEGEWVGDCEGESGDIGLEIAIDTDAGGEVYGSALARFSVGGASTDAELDLEGIRDGADFDLELDSSGWALTLEGAHQGGEMEGDCLLEITVLGFTVAEEGLFLLERKN
jgi:hypothetical protein